MLICVTTVEVCDATKADSSNADDPIIISILNDPNSPLGAGG